MAGNRDEEDRHGHAMGATFGAQQFESHSGGLQYTSYHEHNYHNHNRNHSQSQSQSTSYQPQHLHPTPILIHSDAYPTALDQHRPLSPSHFSHAHNNLQAFNANATNILPVDVDVVEPDDFYKNYRGFDTSVTTPSGHSGLMASAIPTPRQTQNASLRSNGNGTTPRHPTIPSAARTGLRPSSRSVSAPIDDKTSSTGAKSRPIAYGSGQKPSVKDLKKRFDQQAAQPTSNSTARKVIPRISTRETSSPGASKSTACPTSPTNAQTSYASLRSSVTRGLDSGTASTLKRSTQRNRSVTEDQVSNNSQSFASRIGKPRASLGAQAPASKSMVSLSQPGSPTSIPPVPQSRGLLFGEILPTESNVRIAGYGIEGVRPRRTSESNLQNPALHLRSLSHPDAEPSSPTDWYRSPADGSRGVHGHTDTNGSIRPRRSRNRSHSDLAGSKPSPQLRITPISRPHPAPANPTSEATPSSRLPVAVRKLNSPVDSPSPSSTRSNSPSTHKRPSAQEKLARATNATRAKTPTNVPSSKRVNRPGTITPNGNTRLNAYISAPPPKLSPPLRSSRPRQPVSAATTASSRLKVIDRERGLDNRLNVKPSEQSTRRRKISMGPIDFESRREQIKLSYTKSIRETEARAAVRKAEEERRKKAEAEARAAKAAARAAEREREEQERIEKEKLEREAKERERLEEERLERERSEMERLEEERLEQERRAGESEETLVKDDSRAVDRAETPETPETSIIEQPILTITTSVAPSRQMDILRRESSKIHNSPTLGIPGSFPDLAAAEDEAPPSAVSNTTEFDIEPQTEPPVPEIPVQAEFEVVDRANENQQSTYTEAEYRSPFDEELFNDDDMSIKISLDAPPEIDALYINSAAIEAGSNTNPTDSRGQDDDEYEPKPLESPPTRTTVTIIGRNSDFQPRDPERNEAAIATDFLHAEGQEDTDLQSEHSDAQLKLSYNADAFLNGDQNDELTRPDDYFIGPSVQDSVARMRDSTREPSEFGNDVATTEHDSPPAAYFDARTTSDMPQSLTIPRTTDVKNRISQTTVWTDYSIDSQNAYSLYGAHERNLQHRDSSFRESTSVSELGSRSQSVQYNRDSREYPSSPEISPRGTYQDLDLSFDKDHQLPEIDTGDSFGIEYITRKNSAAVSSIPDLPDHAPPPPPDVASFPDATSSAAPSEYFDDTRPSSYMRTSKDDRSVFSMDPSLRESEDFAQSESAPQSLYQTLPDFSEGLPGRSAYPDSRQSLAESADKPEEDPTLSPQERKRLFTRLETIKELVDTEAFFIRDMNIVEEIYKGTAEACPQLDDTTIKLIFRNTDQIIAFHSSFLSELKEGVSSVYTPKIHRNIPRDTSTLADGSPQSAGSKPSSSQLSDEDDRHTSLGPIFIRNIEKMKAVHEAFLKNSDHAAKRLIQIQEDPTVKVWLNECNEVARDLTKAWNLDSLLIKPMQRITKYPNLIIQLLHETPQDHPDRPQLESAKGSLENAIVDINKTKKNFELVGQIVGRKRKESDVKAGFARAFGKRVDKLQTASNRPPEDPEYLKLHEKFGDDYLRLQVVLRDVEYYTRQVTGYVHEFLQYLSSMELVMRLQPSPHPELESKWVRFNVSMRDVEKVALEQHVSCFPYLRLNKDYILTLEGKTALPSSKTSH